MFIYQSVFCCIYPFNNANHIGFKLIYLHYFASHLLSLLSGRLGGTLKFSLGSELLHAFHPFPYFFHKERSYGHKQKVPVLSNSVAILIKSISRSIDGIGILKEANKKTFIAKNHLINFNI